MQLLCKVRQANKVENVINGNLHSGGGSCLFTFIIKLIQFVQNWLEKFRKNCHDFNSFLVLLWWLPKGVFYTFYKFLFSPPNFSLFFSREDQSKAVHSGPVFQSLKRMEILFIIWPRFYHLYVVLTFLLSDDICKFRSPKGIVFRISKKAKFLNGRIESVDKVIPYNSNKICL